MTTRAREVEALRELEAWLRKSATATHDIARASALSALIAECEWQPIETAPKDGTRFLAFAECIYNEEDEDGRIVARNQIDRYSVVAYWIFEAIVPFPFSGGIARNIRYTHWRPLPPQPVPVGEE